MPFCPSCFESDRRVPYDAAGHCFGCAPGSWSPSDEFRPDPEVSAWIEQLRTLDEHLLSDAEADLCVLARLGFVPDDYRVVATAARALYEAHLARQPAPPPEPEGSHYGTPDTRASQVGCQCTFVKSLGVSNPKYGERWIVKFQTPCGCELVWFASSNKWLPDAGTIQDIKFTVSKHDAYNGRKNTIIQRVAPL